MANGPGTMAAQAAQADEKARKNPRGVNGWKGQIIAVDQKRSSNGSSPIQDKRR